MTAEDFVAFKKQLRSLALKLVPLTGDSNLQSYKFIVRSKSGKEYIVTTKVTTLGD